MTRISLHILLLLSLATALRAQPAPAVDFCVLKEVKVDSLSNGVRLHLIADGLIQVAAAPGGATTDPQRISFMLPNARGAPAQMVPVGKYPVSHLEFALPSETRQGVGILCTVVLFRPGRLTSLGTDSAAGGRGDTAPGIQVMVLKTQQQDELLVMVTSDRAQERPRPLTGAAAPTVMRCTGPEDCLNLHAVNADATLLMERLTAATGVPILVEDTVQRQISAHLEGLSLHELLSVLTSGSGLALSWQDGHYVISSGLTDTATSYAASGTRRVPLAYLTPAQGMTLLPEIMLGYVRPDVSGNALIASGPPGVLDKIEADLRALDQPTYQCLLRAWTISADGNDNEVRRLLLRASGHDTTGQGDSFGGLSLEVGAARAPELLAEIRALASQGHLQVRTTASMLVANGQSASLLVGDKTFYWRLVGNWRQRVILSSLESGSRLDFTPRTSGGPVTASLAVEASSISGRNDLGPVVNRRSVRATVRLLPRETLILGGLETASADRRQDAGPPVWPLSSALAGRENQDLTRQVWVLVQAEARLAPALAERAPAPAESKLEVTP